MAKTNETGAEKIQRARVKLVLEQPFFGMLTLSQLEVVRKDDCPGAMGTDGRKLYYRDADVRKWTLAETAAVICHEVLHAANQHLWRRDARDPWRWNVACDFAINPIVEECGMTLPAGALLKKEWAGKCAEEIYRLLPPDLNQVGVSNQYTLKGDMIEPTSGSGNAEEQKAVAAAWGQAVRQAAQAAKMQGKLPAGLERLIDLSLRPKCDWKALLARFVQSATKSDYSWKRPNRRYLGAGVWLPSLWTESTRPVVVAIDTSGSIGEKELAVFAAELQGVCSDAQPERVHVLWADAEVAGVQTFERGEPLALKPQGGGGTDFRPVFEWVREHSGEEDFACVIYLTDMYGSFPDVPCEVPTLWVATSDVEAPWGETIKLEAE